MTNEGWAGDDTLERAREYYEQRTRRFVARAGKIDDDGSEDRSEARQRVLRRVYQAERRAIVQLRNSGGISNELMHRLEHELDLEESYLQDELAPHRALVPDDATLAAGAGRAPLR